MAAERVRLVVQGDRDVPDGDDWLNPAEQAELGSFTRDKRRHDWRLRRWTAKRAIALAVASTDAARITVDHTEEGAPLARVDGASIPFAVSVSDSQGWALAAIAPAELRIGCDIELVEPRSDAFVRAFLDDDEQSLVGLGEAVDANVVWSAKEAALKALGVGLDRPTRSVHVTFRVSGDEEGWVPLHVTSDEDRVALDGWWRRAGKFVVTVVGDGLESPPTFAVFSAPD